jgi:hypothetical protein
MASQGATPPHALESPTSEPGGPPARLEPMMLAYLTLTGDTEQYARWKDRLEGIRQAEAIERTRDPEERAILANKEAWRQARETGKLGALFGLGLASLWMSFLIPTYALGHGFGWLAALTFLLPVPLAWKVSRRAWERATIRGMRDLGRRPTMRRRMRALGLGLARSFGAGFAFGFALVFLQGLLTWFMTPAPTLMQELWLDLVTGGCAGAVTGGMAMLLGPLVGRPVPEAADALGPGGAALPALARGED